MRIVLGLVILFIAGAAIPHDPGPADELDRVLRVDPQQAVTEAIARGDLRFLALDPDRPVVPGVPAEMEQLVLRFGKYTLPGTTTRPKDPRQAARVRAARDYAERYNRLLLEWMRQADLESSHRRRR